MKAIVLILVCLFCSYTYGQERVFNYDSQGKIIPQSKYIKPFDDGMSLNQYTNITPYNLKLSQNIHTPSGNLYTVEFLRFKGWEGEPGNFNVIEINKDGYKIFDLACALGWLYFPNNLSNSTTTKGCFEVNLGMDTIALIFYGTIISSQPPLITIIILKDGKATLVFNKPSFIEKVQQSNSETTLALCANTVEWRKDGTPFNDAIINTLTIKDGMIYFK